MTVGGGSTTGAGTSAGDGAGTAAGRAARTGNLAVRVIPCLDVTCGPGPDGARPRVVKGVQFVDLKDAGDPVELASLYDREGADELVFLDITASAEEREILAEVVAATAEQVFIPLTVGGGIRTVEDVRRMLRAGADKVSLNTAAVERPEVLSEAAAAFGSQCVVLAVDARRRDPRDPGSGWEVHIHGGRTPTGRDAVSWMRQCEERGAGEILLTSMDRDGTREGFDLDLLAAATEAVNVPVIASGGAGEAAHLVEAVTVGGAGAVLAASIFHYGDLRIGQVKEVMRAAGLPVRQPSAAD